MDQKVSSANTNTSLKNSKSLYRKTFGDGIFYHLHESKEQNDFSQEANQVDLNKVISKDLLRKIENTSPCMSNRSSNCEDFSKKSNKSISVMSKNEIVDKTKNEVYRCMSYNDNNKISHNDQIGYYDSNHHEKNVVLNRNDNEKEVDYEVNLRNIKSSDIEKRLNFQKVHGSHQYYSYKNNKILKSKLNNEKPNLNTNSSSNSHYSYINNGINCICNNISSQNTQSYYYNHNFNINFHKNHDEANSIYSTSTTNCNSNNIINSHSHYHSHTQNYLYTNPTSIDNIKNNVCCFPSHQSDNILHIKHLYKNFNLSNSNINNPYTYSSKGFMHGKNGWHCHSCNNFNFEGRSKCNKCKKYPIDLIINNDKNNKNTKNSNMHIQTVYNHKNSNDSTKEKNEMTNKKKTKKKLIERSGDWTCIHCKNINFSFRKRCNRCNCLYVNEEKYANDDDFNESNK